VLLITIDTLRADHLGAYGYERATTPNLDELAEQSVVFESAQASSSWTLPAVASLLTSQYASSHGAVGNDTPVPEAALTLAEVLRPRGWASAAVVSHIFVSRRYGFAQGFDEFHDGIIDTGDKNPHKQISSPWINQIAFEWLDRRQAQEPWFLWLHYFDPHHKFLEHEGLDFGEERVDRYDGEIAFTDRHIGELLDKLEHEELLEQTLVVVAADHGEEFGDHGGEGHRKTLYREVVRVPLIVRAPGIAPSRVRAQVRTIDLAPTVCELLGIAPPELFAGKSLVPLLRGESGEDRDALAELRDRGAEFDALAADGFKLIHDRLTQRFELYELGADVEERTDLSAREPERVEALRARMEAALAEARSRAPRAEPTLELGEEEREFLRALGYGD
jgi:arylsulfatase A-like enzyme